MTECKTRRRLVKQKRILVVGASGFVGKNLVLELTQKYRVSILVRPTSNIELFKDNPNIRILYGDLESNRGIAESLDNIDIVIHCAAKTMGQNYWQFYRTNTEGTAHLINAMLEKNVQRILYLSSHAAYGPSSSNRPMQEHEQTKPISAYGQTKSLAEDLVIRSGLSFTILRPVSVYGPHDKEILTYVKLLHRGFCPVIGFGPKYLNLIYVKDLVNIIIKVIEKNHFANKIHFANDGHCYSFDSILDTIAATLNRTTLKIRIPVSVALFVGLLNDVFLSPEKKLVTRDKIRELACQYWVCSSASIYKEIGFTPRYAFDQGIVETIDWYRKQGHLA
jgi:dihydroflavonol-4-reductase